MPEDILKIAALLSPFVSAGIAGWIAYRAGSKRAKSDAFLERRLVALEKIHLALVHLQTYADSRINELEGNEYAPHPEEGKNINHYCFPLWTVRDHEDLFLTNSERTKLNELDSELHMCRTMERLTVLSPKDDLDEDESMGPDKEVYKKICSGSGTALETLYSEMRKAYGI
ncbi:MAG: hypothetical protein ACRBC3_23440 [Burkholderiaceae bacterium]